MNRNTRIKHFLDATHTEIDIGEPTKLNYNNKFNQDIRHVSFSITMKNRNYELTFTYNMSSHREYISNPSLYLIFGWLFDATKNDKQKNLTQAYKLFPTVEEQYHLHSLLKKIDFE